MTKHDKAMTGMNKAQLDYIWDHAAQRRNAGREQGDVVDALLSAGARAFRRLRTRAVDAATPAPECRSV